MKSIIFICHVPHSVINFIPIIKLINKQYPEFRVKLIDLSNCFSLPEETDKNILKGLRIDIFKIVELISNKSEDDFLLWFRKFITNEKPMAIILPLDWWIYSSIIEEAVQLGIKTVIVQESILDETILVSKPNKNRKISTSESFGTKEKAVYCLTGNYYKNLLIDRFPHMKDHYYVTGSLKMEYRFMETEIFEQSVKKKLGLTSDDDFLLYISQDFDNWPLYYQLKYSHRESIMDAITCAFNLNPALTHVVMVHPGENIRMWRKTIGNQKSDSPKIILLQSPSFSYLSLYKSALGLIGFSSTCLIEAMYIGKPIMTFDYVFQKPVLSLLKEKQTIIPVESKDKLPEALRYLLTGTFSQDLFRRQLLLAEDVFGFQDGRCSYRAMEVINS